MQLSATLAMNEEMARRRAAGQRVLPLGFGEAGLPVPGFLAEALHRAADHSGYGPVAGIPELRTAAAGYWSRRGLPTDGEQVVAGPGSKPLLYALLAACEGAVAVPRPSWVSYAAQAALLHRPVHRVPTPPGEGGVPDPERLDDAARRARARGAPIRAVVLTLPDNPTGTLARPATVRAVCQVAERHDLLVVSDEIYRDLLHDEATEFLSPAEVIPERSVVTTGLSKNLAVGGWRLGLARFPATGPAAALRPSVLTLASEIWSAPARPVQHVAAWALTEPAEVRERVARSRRLHAAVARAVAAELRAAGATLPAPQAAFYLYPDLAAHADRFRRSLGVEGGSALAGALLDRAGIATLPAAAFGETDDPPRLRVATALLYGDSAEQREAALAADDPAGLPWVAEQVELLRAGLRGLTVATAS